MMDRKYGCFIAVGGLILVLLAFNFLNFYAARSETNSEFSLSTARSGDELPSNMASPFNLAYRVTSKGPLANALHVALQAELAALPTILQASPFEEHSPNEQLHPRLSVEVRQNGYLWTPFYASGTATAVVSFASEGDVSWHAGESLVLETSPAIKSEGEFTLDDHSWGVISKPAYTQHLSQKIARAIAERLQQDVFTYAPGQ